MNLEPLQNLPVAVLLGGASPERDISLLSGETVADTLDTLGASVRRVDPAERQWWQQLEGAKLAFIVLHGPGGEDGVTQGALETLGIPYTGSGVLASALSMDKVTTKRLWKALNLPTADFVEVGAESDGSSGATDWQTVSDTLGEVFVKPAGGGSSLGIARVGNAKEWAQAQAEASRFSDRVIAEQLIDGPEYTVSILGERALPAIKVETGNLFYDYEAKYLSDDTRYICPCGLDGEEERQIADLSLRAFRSLGCRVWGRVDLMRAGDGRFLLLEVNTVPGMTGHSLVPMAAKAAGIELPELVGQIALLSLGGEG